GAMPVLWAANGLFQAMVWPPIVRLFAECMPFEQQDSACVSINSTTPAGTLGAYALSAAALALAGWRMAFWTCGVLMLALACLLALPMAVKASLPASLVLLAATTALMLGVNTMFINVRSEEHTSELQSRFDLVCRLLLEKKKEFNKYDTTIRIFLSEIYSTRIT